MRDIAACCGAYSRDNRCPLRDRCYRAELCDKATIAEDIYQTFTEPKFDGDKCEFFLCNPDKSQFSREYPQYIGRNDQRGRAIYEGDKVEFTLIHTCGRKKHVFTGTVKRLDLDGRPYIETDNWNINYLLSEVARIKILR